MYWGQFLNTWSRQKVCVYWSTSLWFKICRIMDDEFLRLLISFLIQNHVSSLCHWFSMKFFPWCRKVVRNDIKHKHNIRRYLIFCYRPVNRLNICCFWFSLYVVKVIPSEQNKTIWGFMCTTKVDDKLCYFWQFLEIVWIYSSTW